MKKDNSNKYIEAGRCHRPHGIKGAFTFSPSIDPELISENLKVSLRPFNNRSSLASEGEQYTISSLRGGHKLMLYLKEVNNRTEAENICPFNLFIERESIASDDDIFAQDLMGLSVVDHLSKEVIGKVEDYYDNGAQIVLVIDGRESFELPFIENFFPEVDLDNNSIEVILPDYED